MCGTSLGQHHSAVVGELIRIRSHRQKVVGVLDRRESAPGHADGRGALEQLLPEQAELPVVERLVGGDDVVGRVGEIEPVLGAVAGALHQFALDQAAPAECIEALYSINQLSSGTNLQTIPREQLRGIVERDTLTHEIFSIEPASPNLPVVDKRAPAQ